MDIMKRLSLDYRKRLSRQDLEFVSTVLGKSASGREAVMKLLTDATMVDRLLDEPALLHAISEATECIPVSPRLYFYLQLRHLMREGGLDDADLTDYLAGLLTEQGIPAGDENWQTPYVTDHLHRIEQVSYEDRFALYIAAGDQMLFITGLFAQHVKERTRRRAAPQLGFYEDFGREAYRHAADHRLCKRIDAGGLLTQLAANFSECRQLLNELAERKVFLEAPPPVDRLDVP